MLVSVKGGEVKVIVDSIMRMTPQRMIQEQSCAEVVCGFLERTQLVVQEEVARNIAQTLTATVRLLVRHRKSNRKEIMHRLKLHLTKIFHYVDIYLLGFNI